MVRCDVVVKARDAQVLTVRSGAELLSCARASCLLVVGEEGNVQGVVTERDIARNGFAGDTSSGLLPTLASVMTKDPICLVAKGERESVPELRRALQLMAQKSFRHVPFIDESGKLLWCCDIMQAIRGEEHKYLAEKLSVAAGKLVRMHASLQRGGFRTASLLQKDQPAQVAASRMKTEGQCALLVQDGESIAGILTESDIVRKAIAMKRQTVAEIMTGSMVTVPADVAPVEALELMISKGFRHLPVRDEASGSVVTILDMLSLIKIAYQSQEQPGGVTEESEKKVQEPASLAAEGNAKCAQLEVEAVKHICAHKFELARDRLSEALRLKPHSTVHARLLTRRASVYSVLGHLELALKDFQNAVELDPACDEAANGACEVLIESGRFEASVALARDKVRAASLLTAEVERFRQAGKDLFLQGDHAGSSSAYTNALRALRTGSSISNTEKESAVLEELAILLSNRAACYQSMSDFKYALQDAQDAVAAFPTYAKAWGRLCDTLIALDQHTRAAEKATEGLKHCPENPKLVSVIQQKQARNLDSIKSLASLMQKQNINKENHAAAN